MKHILKKITQKTLQKPKVNLVIAGTQKGGTSAMDAYLRMHPQICMARKKEVHFFDNEKFFNSKTVNYNRYHSFFTPNAIHKVIGESTPIYMYWFNAPKRIWKYNPNIKFIIILRNPIERAFSHWNMERDRKTDTLTFWDAIQTERKRCRKALPYQHRIFSYVDRGMYTEQLRRIWHFFPKKQTLILKNENLRNNHEDIMEKVSNFLEINKFQYFEPKDVHSRPYISKIRNKEREYLAEIYFHEIRSLEKLLGWDCKNWLSIST